MKRIFLPFDLAAFKDLNSNHPLPVSLTLPRYQDVEFVRALAKAPVGAAATTLNRAAAFADDLRKQIKGPQLSDDVLLAFITTRELTSQTRYDTTADLAFFHTAPVLINQMPYLLHIESITTLFAPLLLEGGTRDVELYRQPVYWFIRAMLESESCRGIFTNLRHTKAQVDRVFDSGIISNKTRHIPAGPYFKPAQEARIAAGFARKRDKQDIEILFTNSWHQRAPNFVFRGGVDLVTAFLQVERTFPNLRLTLRTTWPDGMEPALTKAVHEHPKITLLPDMLSDDEILELFIRADIFFLDAASLHSISLLRAMYCGAACVVSNAPGYDEYVTHGETAVVVPGRREKIYSEDPSSGWLRTDFSPMLSVTTARIELLGGIISWLCANETGRLTLGANARDHVMRKNNFAGWQNGFESMLRAALAPSN